MDKKQVSVRRRTEGPALLALAPVTPVESPGIDVPSVLIPTMGQVLDSVLQPLSKSVGAGAAEIVPEVAVNSGAAAAVNQTKPFGMGIKLAELSVIVFISAKFRRDRVRV